jgi:peroxiredoxin
MLRTEGEMTEVNAGNRAPSFSVKGLDGKSYSLSSLLQKGPVVAAFFKVSCPVCQFTFPFLERLFKSYGGGDVTFLGISQDDTKATKKFIDTFGVTFPVALDEEGYPASNAYGLSMVPTIFLIDADGTTRVSSMGFVKKDLESIAKELATRESMPSGILFRPNERIPEQKPG